MKSAILAPVAILGVSLLAAAAGFMVYRAVKRDTEQTVLQAAAENSDDLGRGIGAGAVDALFRNARILLSGGDGEGTVVNPSEGEI